MWLISWLPQWVYYAGLVCGVGASLINSRGSHIVGALVIAGSCWHLGGMHSDQQWQARAEEMQAKVALAEEKSLALNNTIVTKTLTKIQLVKETTSENIKYIQQTVAQDLDSDCRLTAATVMLHNSSSQGEVPGSTPSVAGTTTTVKASELLETVAQNYGTYYELAERLRAWQAWYYQQKKIFEE